MLGDFYKFTVIAYKLYIVIDSCRVSWHYIINLPAYKNNPLLFLHHFDNTVSHIGTEIDFSQTRIT